MTLDQIHASLVELFRQIVAESDDEWNVFEHEWIDAIHAPCVIVGPVRSTERDTFTQPRHTFEVRLWVNPREDAKAIPSLHRAIDVFGPDSFVARLRALADAADWGLFDLSDANEIRTRSFSTERFTGVEATIPISISPPKEG